MDVTPSEQLSIDGIFLEILDNHPYKLTTEEKPLPASNLKYEFATLTSEYLPDASNSFRWFRNLVSHCNSQNGRKLIDEMVKVFLHYKDEFSEPVRKYVLSYGVVEGCYRLQIDDSQLMKRVLDLMYENSISLESFHSPGREKRGYFRAIGGRKNTNTNQPDFLTFYLEHARRLKLEYNGARFFDVCVYFNFGMAPVFIAAVKRYWKPLLRFLQFGAQLEEVVDDSLATHRRVKPPLTFSLRYLIGRLWFKLIKPATALSLTDPKVIQEYCSNVNEEVLDLCHILRILLRTVKRLRHDVLEFTIQDTPGPVQANSYRVINHPIVHLMLPTLSQR